MTSLIQMDKCQVVWPSWLSKLPRQVARTVGVELTISLDYLYWIKAFSFFKEALGKCYYDSFVAFPIKLALLKVLGRGEWRGGRYQILLFYRFFYSPDCQNSYIRFIDRPVFELWFSGDRRGLFASCQLSFYLKRRVILYFIWGRYKLDAFLSLVY